MTSSLRVAPAAPWQGGELRWGELARRVGASERSMRLLLSLRVARVAEASEGLTASSSRPPLVLASLLKAGCEKEE